MKTIALIFGGPSAEHEVSLVSARNIFTQLEALMEKVVLLGVTKDRLWKLIDKNDLLSTDFNNPLNLDKLGTEVFCKSDGHSVFLYDQQGDKALEQKLDLAFPIIHGTFGEDGELQNLMSEWNLPFVGSASAGCAHAFDKAKTKKILEDFDIPQVPYLLVEDEIPGVEEIEAKVGFPFFVKPASMGSSVGITKVKSKSQWSEALKEAQKYDKKILIEKSVENCREIECAILEDNGTLKVTGLGEIKPKHEFYSYHAKYIDPDGAELIIPASIDAGLEQKIQDLAKKSFQKLDCRDYARVDFFISTDNQVYFNELNTHPGFTNISMFPLLWKEAGMETKDLVAHLIGQAEARLENENN